jgi:hypothetical protein
MSSFAVGRAGNIDDADSDAVLMQKAKEIQERAKGKAESLERYEKSTKNRQEYR